MMTIDVQKIKKLLAAGKLDEAKKVIETGVKTTLSPAERGAIYLDLMRGYMRIATELNNQYSKFLNEALELDRQLKKEERKLSDNRKLRVLQKRMSAGKKKQ